MRLSITLFLLIIFNTQLMAGETVKLPASCSVDKILNMVQCPLADDISIDDAIDSMKLRANVRNFKLVAHLPLSKQVIAMGQKSSRMEIFQFCDALIAKQMVEFNKLFAGFLPCRIAVVADAKGKGWLVTMNMDTMLQAAGMTPRLKKLGKTVRDSIYSIVAAGVNGDL